MDNSPECYPEVPDIWYEEEIEPEVEEEWDWSAFEEVDEKEDAPEPQPIVEDPVEPAETVWTDWTDPEPEPEGEPVYTVEVQEASGCQTGTKASPFGFAAIFLVVYSFGFGLGYYARKRHKEED